MQTCEVSKHALGNPGITATLFIDDSSYNKQLGLYHLIMTVMIIISYWYNVLSIFNFHCVYVVCDGWYRSRYRFVTSFNGVNIVCICAQYNQRMSAKRKNSSSSPFILLNDVKMLLQIRCSHFEETDIIAKTFFKKKAEKSVTFFVNKKCTRPIYKLICL